MGAFRQFKAMMRKNFIIKKRLFWKQTLWEVLVPLMFGICLGFASDIILQKSEGDDIQTVMLQVAILFGLGLCFFAMAFALSATFILNQLVVDKENRMRETLKIMSLNRWSYAASYLVTQSVFAALTALSLFIGFVSAFSGDHSIKVTDDVRELQQRRIPMNGDFGPNNMPDFGPPQGKSFRQYATLLLALVLFGINIIAVSMTLSAFFKNGNFSTQGGLLLLFIPTSFLFFLFVLCWDGSVKAMLEPEPYYGEMWFEFMYWFPTFPFGRLLLEFLIDHGGPAFFFQMILPLDVQHAWCAMIVTIPIYFCLYVYLDAVIPNAYGIASPWCFCLEDCRKSKKSKNCEIHHQNSSFELELERQGTSKSKRPEELIKMTNLQMIFGKFRAVENMTMTVNKGDIVALLGHNGAGKTTTINMLTGMIHPTSGEALINGKSIEKEVQEARRDLGLCQQHDVLYDRLTVREHLDLVCGLKDVPYEEVKSEIDNMLNLTLLKKHQYKMAMELSGGMKRKLSLGMSLIGKSSVIILDEPTSGLDVDSRRQIWELIKKVRKSRAIIMSTQHIEEADELANHVCVMSHGKIVVEDTPEKIKVKFGVGYTLIVEWENKNNRSLIQDRESLSPLSPAKQFSGKESGNEEFTKQLDAIIFNQEIIRGVTEAPSSTSQGWNQTKKQYCIPFTQSYKIATLLKELENRFPECLIAIEMASLEDAYLRIIEEQDRISTLPKTDTKFQTIDVDKYQSTSNMVSNSQKLAVQTDSRIELSPIQKQESQDANDEFNASVRRFKNTYGKQTCCKMACAFTQRRLKMFSRSKDQWFLLLSPFLNIISLAFMFEAFKRIFPATRPFDIIVSEQEQQDIDKGFQVKGDVLLDVGIGFMTPFVMNYSFTSSSSIFMIVLLEDRERQTKQILNIAGVPSFVYYWGHFCADILLYFPMLTIMWLFIEFLTIRIYYEELVQFLGIFFAFGPPLVCSTYAFQLLFDKIASANRMIIPVFLLVATVIPLSVCIYFFMTDPNDTTMGYYIVSGIMFFLNPFFAFFYGNFSILVNTMPRRTYVDVIPGLQASPTVILLAFLGQTILLFSLVVCIDHRRSNKFRKADKNKPKIEQPQLDINNDVKILEKDVLEGEDQDKWLIKANDLHKIYPGKGLHAVCGNTFGVEKGTVMGLLGPNGAGKSTTFGMLSMAFPRSSGKIEIFDSQIESVNLKKYGQYIGMCPQHNTIWENLTVQENLDFLGKIKGISDEDRKENENLIIKTMALEEFRDVDAGKLSGGNKRKLTCALSLLLCPRVEYLDEPTTGVDPISRQALFNMVRQLDESGVVLTTHRMDEASQLCDKIAIMINGRIICYGSPNYLLQEYGSGYQFNITINSRQITLDNAKLVIKERIPQAEFVNETILQSFDEEDIKSPNKSEISSPTRSEISSPTKSQNDHPQDQLIQLNYKVLNIKGVNQQNNSVISPEENDIEDDCLNLSTLFFRLQELIDGEENQHCKVAPEDTHTVIPGASHRTQMGTFDAQGRSRARLNEGLKPAASQVVSAVRLPSLGLSPERSETALITENEKGDSQMTQLQLNLPSIGNRETVNINDQTGRISESSDRASDLEHSTGFIEYYVSRTTLEQVFTSFARFQHNQEETDQKK